MADKNFVVRNGLTVGPLTINAATGDINTPGNVNISGSLGISQIAKNDSYIAINDTGSGSSVVIQIDGATEHTVDSNGVSLATGDRYAINDVSVLDATTLGSSVVNSSLTTVGNLTALNVAGDATVYGNLTVQGLSTLNGGTLTLGDANTDNVVFGADVNSSVIPNTNNTYSLGSSGQVWANVFATNLTGTLQTASQPNITSVGTLASLSVTGNVSAANLTGTLLTASQTNITTVGNLTALSVAGDTSIYGNLTVQGLSTLNGGTLTLGDANTDNVVFGADVNSNVRPNTDNTYGLGTSSNRWADLYAVKVTANVVTIGGKSAATVDDATALAIALGG